MRRDARAAVEQLRGLLLRTGGAGSAQGPWSLICGCFAPTGTRSRDVPGLFAVRLDTGSSVAIRCRVVAAGSRSITLKIAGHRPWAPLKDASGLPIANPTPLQRAAGLLPLKIKPSTLPPRAKTPPDALKTEVKRLYPMVAPHTRTRHQTMLACVAKADGRTLEQPLRVGDFAHAERSLNQAMQAIDEVPGSGPSTYDVTAQRLPEALSMLYRDFDQLPILRDIKPESRHRLVIDPCQLRTFEGRAANAGIDVTTSPYAGLLFPEKGYLFGMANGYKLAFEHVDCKLSVRLLAALHAASTDGNPDLPGGFNAKGAAVFRQVGGGLLNQQGLDEFFLLQDELQMQLGIESPLVVEDMGGGNWWLGIAPSSSRMVESIAARWIDHCHATVAKIGNGNDSEATYMRLLAALDCLRKCLRLHSFEDGTGRLYQQVALNRELAHLGLPISLLDNPSLLPGVSLDQALELVIDGMRDAKAHLKDGAPCLENSVLDVSPALRKAYVDRYKAVFTYRDPRTTSTSNTGPPSLEESAALAFEWLERNDHSVGID